MELSNILWGDDSAERDPNLLNYFISHTSLNRLKSCSKSIIIGRKGAGKSAIRKKLTDYFQKEECIVIDTAPSYSMMTSISSNKEIISNYDNDIFFQYIWLRHLFKLALIKIGDTAKGKYCTNSLQYARELAIKNSQTQKDLLESVTDVLTKIKVRAGNLGDLGLNVEGVIKSESEVDVYEYHLSELEKEGFRVIFIIDDLDLGWNNSKTANNLLLGLLTTANYIKDISHNIHMFILLRDDVYRILLTQTQHSDKFRDIETIKWSNSNLITLLSERIKYNFEKHNCLIDGDMFARVFPQSVGASNITNWLIERTLGRPRELIQLSRIYTESNESNQPNADLLKKAEMAYSNWKLDDLSTEFKYQYPGLTDIFNCWKTKFYRNKYHLKKKDYENILETILEEANCNEDWFVKIKAQKNINDLLKILYQIGFIGDFIQGGAGGNKTIYSFEEVHDPVFKEIQIHPCFRKAMGTVERIRKSKQSE